MLFFQFRNAKFNEAPDFSFIDLIDGVNRERIKDVSPRKEPDYETLSYNQKVTHVIVSAVESGRKGHLAIAKRKYNSHLQRSSNPKGSSAAIKAYFSRLSNGEKFPF